MNYRRGQGGRARMSARRSYPSNVRDEEREFVAPCLSLLPLDAGQRDHNLRMLLRLGAGRLPAPTAIITDMPLLLAGSGSL